MPAPTEILADNLRFLRALVTRPKNIGAIVPSSRALARAIAAQIDPVRPGPVLELGPGTGVVTEALLERGLAGERLTLVEYDAEMAACLARRFRAVEVIEGDAFDLGRTLGPRASQSFQRHRLRPAVAEFPLPPAARLCRSGLPRCLRPAPPSFSFPMA